MEIASNSKMEQIRAVHCRTGMLPQCLTAMAAMAQIPTAAYYRMFLKRIISRLTMVATMIRIMAQVVSVKRACQPILTR